MKLTFLRFAALGVYLCIYSFQTGVEFDQRLPLPTRHQHPGAQTETQWHKFGCHQVSST